MIDPKDLQNMLGSVQSQIKDMEEQSRSKIIEVNSGGGMVSAKFNGAGELVDIEIDDELLSDKSTLQILLIGAINDGFKEIERSKKDDILGKLKDINIMNFLK